MEALDDESDEYIISICEDVESTRRQPEAVPNSPFELVDDSDLLDALDIADAAKASSILHHIETIDNAFEPNSFAHTLDDRFTQVDDDEAFIRACDSVLEGCPPPETHDEQNVQKQRSMSQIALQRENAIMRRQLSTADAADRRKDYFRRRCIAYEDAVKCANQPGDNRLAAMSGNGNSFTRFIDLIGDYITWPFFIRRAFWSKDFSDHNRMLVVNFSILNGVCWESLDSCLFYTLGHDVYLSNNRRHFVLARYRYLFDYYGSNVNRLNPIFEVPKNSVANQRLAKAYSFNVREKRVLHLNHRLCYDVTCACMRISAAVAAEAEAEDAATAAEAEAAAAEAKAAAAAAEAEAEAEAAAAAAEVEAALAAAEVEAALAAEVEAAADRATQS